MKLKIWEWALICAVVLTFVGGVTVGARASELSGKLIRLHVVANSDSREDQELKLKVRDAVLEELRADLQGVGDRARAVEVVGGRLEEIKKAAEGVVRENGQGYEVSVTLCREMFPTTEYESFALPAGEYMSLRVTLGEGAGHNWWCVVFPPICDAGTLDAQTSAAIGLTEDEVRVMTEDSGGYVVKFRALELWGWLRGLFR